VQIEKTVVRWNRGEESDLICVRRSV